LTEGLFECRTRGAAILEGQPAAVPIWQVLRPSMADSRFEARRGIAGEAPLAAESLTPFVGRGRELEVLMRGHEHAATRLLVIDIVGDAGIGKSRLLHEFRAQLIGDGVFVLSGSCWPDSQQAPFRPFIDVVRRSFRVGVEDSDTDAAMKFATALEFLGLPGVENVGLLMNLLGRAPPTDSLSGLDGVLIGLRTRDLLLGLLRERSRIAPLALMIEDAHWIDRASQDLLAQLVTA
jgi:predicted ATPase